MSSLADPVFLSRLQFAFTAGFHFLFPPISIGLAWILFIYEFISWRTGREDYERAAKLFAKLLALTFGMGVVTGVVLEFQFGMNWAGYAKFVGDIFGAPLAAEAVFAFFLESVFLGLYLFGRNKLSKGWLCFSIFMVAVGAGISAFWIIVANSWQQTPAGFEMRNGRAELVSFWAAVFNPSSLYRYAHTMWAALVTGGFFAAGCAAFVLLRNQSHAAARAALKVAVPFGFVAAVLVAFPSGHEHARQVARTQPEKFAAMEGLYETQTHAPLLAFGLVKNKPPAMRAKIELPIPGLLGWMAFGDPAVEIKGIDAFPPENIPPLWITFVSFHNMVILGMLFLAVLGAALLQQLRGRLFDSRRLLWALLLVSPLPLAANEFGWVAAEVGRQPWIVYQVMRTSEAVSRNLSAVEVWISLGAYLIVYALLLVLYLYVLLHLLKKESAGGEARAA